jgi:type I restriction-modification system DNA methylase subunit
MDTELMEKQVISKKRVTDHGEVLTGRREVNAMLDLVKQETERIESRFLEPACGTGNFLTEILERKAITSLSPHCGDFFGRRNCLRTV